MVEWIAQWNGYVPAAVNVRPSLFPLAMVGVKHEPSSSVAVDTIQKGWAAVNRPARRPVPLSGSQSNAHRLGSET